MNTDEVLDIFREAGAVLEGHFILTSGLRSPVFLQKARVFMHADKTERLCQALAEKIRAEVPGGIDYVVGPAIGGLIPAYETSRHLGVPAIWVEREAGRVPAAPLRDREGRARRHRRGHRHHRPVDPRDHRMPARAWRRGGRRRLHHRPLGRQDRCRRAADRARRIRGSGLSGRQLPPELAAIPPVKPGSRNI